VNPSGNVSGVRVARSVRSEYLLFFSPVECSRGDHKECRHFIAGDLQPLPDQLENACVQAIVNSGNRIIQIPDNKGLIGDGWF
jgi:hypothetical protein